MRTFSTLSLSLMLSIAACSGGSSTTLSNAVPIDRGAVLVVVETRAGSDAFVQFQLAGATLEDAAGTQTANLLPESTMLTVGDATGEPAGLRLNPAPAGDYAALVLVLVPNSGIAIAPDGSSQAVTSPVDVRVPIAGGLQHDPQSASWLVIAHDAVPLSGPPGALSWNPSMSGRLDGASLRLDELRFPVVNQNLLAATATTIGNASVDLACSSTCIYEDEGGIAYASRAAFLTSLSIDDDLLVDGDLRRDGRMDATRIRRTSRNDQPRLVGNILSIDAATNSFEMLVVATRRNGNQVYLVTPELAVIRAQNAIIEAANSSTTNFSSLMVAQLVKVKWWAKSTSNGVPEYIAREVELLGSSNTQIHPEWEALVQSVDVTNQVIVIVPRNNDPIVIQGVSVPQAEVLVSNTTSFERRENHGGSNFAITLAQIQPGTDRIWIRGTVVGPTVIEATRVRVRED